jgi:hypothetical protein
MNDKAWLKLATEKRRGKKKGGVQCSSEFEHGEVAEPSERKGESAQTEGEE